jgi:hypothetical protein
MKKFDLLFCIILLPFYIFSQKIIPFERVSHELGGDEGAGILARVASDSQNIYVLGHLPKKIAGTNNYSHPVIGSISYDGNIKSVQILVDSTISPALFDYSTMIRKNDSVYLGTFFVPIPNNTDRAAIAIFEIDMKNNKILQRKYFYDFIKYPKVNIVTDNQLKDSVFQIVLETTQDNSQIKTAFLYEFDLNLNIKKEFEIKYDNFLSFYRWVSGRKDSIYEIIVNHYEYLNGKQSGKVQLSYLKVDSKGNVLKKKDLPLKGNFGVIGGESWTILQDDDRSFVIGCVEYILHDGSYLRKPYILKTSYEFDSLLWSIKFFPFDSTILSPRFSINDLVKMKDNNGYLLCGDWETPPYSEPDYGLLMKVSNEGDSLWMRKYVPLTWDSIRAKGAAMTLKQLNITPYNTIAIVGSISDQTTGWWHPWILHLDSDGCIIPGCADFVKTNEIENIKKEAFVIYPNPIEGDYLYILSRINSDKNYFLSIKELSGKSIQTTQFKPQEGVQYVLHIPKEIPNGGYIISINGDVLLAKQFIIAR